MKPLKVTVIAQRLAESVFLQKNCGDVNLRFFVHCPDECPRPRSLATLYRAPRRRG
jgi:hypothetical protein